MAASETRATWQRPNSRHRSPSPTTAASPRGSRRQSWDRPCAKPQGSKQAPSRSRRAREPALQEQRGAGQSPPKPLTQELPPSALAPPPIPYRRRQSLAPGLAQERQKQLRGGVPWQRRLGEAPAVLKHLQKSRSWPIFRPYERASISSILAAQAVALPHRCRRPSTSASARGRAGLVPELWRVPQGLADPQRAGGAGPAAPRRI